MVHTVEEEGGELLCGAGTPEVPNPQVVFSPTCGEEFGGNEEWWYTTAGFVLFLGYPIWFELRHQGRTPGSAMARRGKRKTHSRPTTWTVLSQPSAIGSSP